MEKKMATKMEALGPFKGVCRNITLYNGESNGKENGKGNWDM